MNEALCNQLSLLSDALHNDPRIVNLSNAEKAMEEDPNVRYLAARMDELSVDYERVKMALGEKSEAAVSAQKALHQAKLALDENPLVADYNANYRLVADLYRKLDDILFYEFRTKNGCGGRR